MSAHAVFKAIHRQAAPFVGIASKSFAKCVRDFTFTTSTAFIFDSR